VRVSVEAVENPGSDASHVAVRSVLPRPFRWVLGFGHPAASLGAAMAVAYLLIVGSALTALGRPSFLPWADLVVQHIIYALYFASVPIAIAILVRGTERDTRDLAGALGAGEGEVEALCRAALDVPSRAVWLGIGFGLLVAFATLWIFFTPVPSVRQEWQTFLVLREITIDIVLFGSLGWAVGAARRLSQLTEQRARPDLLVPGAFAGLARHGSRLAAVWLVLMAMGLPGFLAVPAGFEDMSRSLLVLTLVLASFAAVALVIPCRGAHRVVRSAKQAELATVRSQIAEARHLREDTRLPGLLAWEARIEQLPEWPIDAPALRRTGLFLLLPLASWVCSALVERLVDASLR